LILKACYNSHVNKEILQFETVNLSYTVIIFYYQQSFVIIFSFIVNFYFDIVTNIYSMHYIYIYI